MSRLLSLISILLLAVGCASGGGTGRADLAPREDRYFLVSPLEGYPRSVGTDVRLQLEKAHRGLVDEGDHWEVESVVGKLTERNPDLAPSAVLEAQSSFVRGLHRQVVETLEPVVAEYPDYVAAQLLYGRSSEKLGSVVEALEAYESIADQSPLAQSRVVELAPAVATQMSRRIDDALAKGDIGQARTELERLQTWAPDADETLEASARVARETADETAELEALRRLAGRDSDDEALNRRLAELELKSGDPAAGMRLIEDLAARHPEDIAIQEELARARFLWRLQLLPPEVSDIAKKPVLTRGDLAVVIYWLFPELRYGRSAEARIANDILDHPQREPIVKVINSGVMDVDPSLHRFDPYRELTRVEALRSMVGLLARKEPPLACLNGNLAPRSRQAICAASAACGLIESSADCLPSGTVSGADAVDLCRLAQELSGGS